jgi:hypothetical protein
MGRGPLRGVCLLTCELDGAAAVTASVWGAAHMRRGEFCPTGLAPYTAGAAGARWQPPSYPPFEAEWMGERMEGPGTTTTDAGERFMSPGAAVGMSDAS